MEDEKVTSLYKKGFNHGYMISQYFPKELEGMKTPENEPSDYTAGFEAGKTEFQRGKVLGQFPERGKERGRN